jgi:signal transduction histidine kinase
VRIAASRSDGGALLAVEDRGPGIPPQARERIFDPYFTTRPEGTGLGLAIVKKIVLQHGGTVEAGNRPGGGARFAIRFPLRAL